MVWCIYNHASVLVPFHTGRRPQRNAPTRRPVQHSWRKGVREGPDLYCDGLAVPPAMTNIILPALARSCSAASFWQFQLFQQLVYILLNVHKTPTSWESRKVGRGQSSMYILYNSSLVLVTDQRVQIDWQWSLSSVHSIMMGNSAQPGEGGRRGAHPPPFTSKVVMNTPSERADTLLLFLLYPLLLRGPSPKFIVYRLSLSFP